MNIERIKIDPYQARAAVAGYLREVRAHHRKEDREILAGYRALAKGKEVISLRSAMETGGFDGKGLPRFAIMRADQARVQVRVEPSGSVCFIPGGRWFSSGRIARDLGFTFRRLCKTPPTWREGNRDAIAIVPIVPPILRKADLSAYHILFEADWTLIPPKDPFLLKRIAQDLFVIVGHWDLTELERAVIGAWR